MTAHDVNMLIIAYNGEREQEKRIQYLKNRRFALQHPFRAVSSHLIIIENFRLRRIDIFYLLEQIFYNRVCKGVIDEYIEDQINIAEKTKQHYMEIAAEINSREYRKGGKKYEADQF